MPNDKDVAAHPDDICACGDYRRAHPNGRCKIHCCECEQFRLSCTDADMRLAEMEQRELMADAGQEFHWGDRP